jgi:hypothetical protein
METVLELIADILRERWSSKLTLILAVIVVGLATLLAVGQFDVGKVSAAGWVIVLLAVILTAALWAYTNRFPRAAPRRVGFVVAITTEKEEHAVTLRSDFTNTMCDLLRQPTLRYPFQFIEYPPRLAAQVTAETAIRYLRKSRAHFIIFGDAKSRRVFGREKHVLNLAGGVIHAPLTKAQSDALATEFAEVFPRRLLVDKENDLFSFQLTSEWVNIAARYIVALAAMISGDLDYAEELFLSVKERLTGAMAQFPAVDKIRQHLPQRLARLYSVKLGWLMRKYLADRDRAHLEASEDVLHKLARYDPGNYSQHLQRAICEFVLHRDVRAAWRSILKCHGIRDVTWRYSEAFLHAYEGNLFKARRSYAIAFRGHTEDPSVPNQTEEFINIVLAQEPDKYQLYFCLGLINLLAKGDFASARRDFAMFLAMVPAGEYAEEQELARDFINRADRELAGGG